MENPAELAIRRYEESDREAVWELHNLALHGIGAHPGNGEWDDDLRDVRGAYLEAGGEFLVGLVEGQVVAMGALKRTSPERAEVTRMRIRPDAQRSGFGQRILTALEAAARRLGYATLHLGTTTRQIPARKLYEKNGYREVDRGEELGFDLIYYEKAFGQSE